MEKVNWRSNNSQGFSPARTCHGIVLKRTDWKLTSLKVFPSSIFLQVQSATNIHMEDQTQIEMPLSKTFPLPNQSVASMRKFMMINTRNQPGTFIWKQTIETRGNPACHLFDHRKESKDPVWFSVRARRQLSQHISTWSILSHSELGLLKTIYPVSSTLSHTTSISSSAFTLSSTTDRSSTSSAFFDGKLNQDQARTNGLRTLLNIYPHCFLAEQTSEYLL